MEINRFRGKYAFLSNFYPCEVVLDGKVYPSVEHAYQASKFKKDAFERELIREIPSSAPAEAKKYGQDAVLPKSWEDDKLVIMWGLLEQKFNKSGFKRDLLATGDAILIEGNTWGDKFWGVCDGEGRNVLGKYLMAIREELKSA